jgi:serine/threonine protein kinase
MEELIYESIDNKYIILKKIDKGKFGEAFLVNEKNKENIKYVAKILLKDDKHFVQKIKLIKTISNLKSPYIIYFKEASKEGKIKLKGSNNNFVTKQYAIYEYAPKKTKFEYLIFHNSDFFEEKYAKILFKYILKGIQAMHDAGICHRNIKLENIFLDEFFKPKICDLGLCKQ